jgi:hypothetical protein
MEIVAQILFVSGSLVGLAGDAMILTEAYRRGTILFIACLVLPFVALGFALVHIRKLWLPLTISVVGGLIAFVGVRLCGSEALLEALFG